MQKDAALSAASFCMREKDGKRKNGEKKMKHRFAVFSTGTGPGG